MPAPWRGLRHLKYQIPHLLAYYKRCCIVLNLLSGYLLQRLHTSQTATYFSDTLRLLTALSPACFPECPQDKAQFFELHTALRFRTLHPNPVSAWSPPILHKKNTDVVCRCCTLQLVYYSQFLEGEPLSPSVVQPPYQHARDPDASTSPILATQLHRRGSWRGTRLSQ